MALVTAMLSCKTSIHVLLTSSEAPYVLNGSLGPLVAAPCHSTPCQWDLVPIWSGA